MNTQRHDDGKIQILPFIRSFQYTWWSLQTSSSHHRHGHHHHHRFGKGSFVNHIHHFLMNLGRWEGRAVAFVLGKTAHFAVDVHPYVLPGCGIGVLLRTSPLSCTALCDEQHEYSQIFEDSEIVDTPKSAPPSYTYAVDEHVFETVKAPSTTEESKSYSNSSITSHGALYE